jgi:hypothetical protein
VSVGTRYEERAAEWDKAGRDPFFLFGDPYEYVRLNLWMSTEGAQREGISPLLKDFRQASIDRLLTRYAADWMDDFCMQRGFCYRCDQRYKYENLSLCTRCDKTYCPSCRWRFEKAPNGNQLHDGCGGEIVG